MAVLGVTLSAPTDVVGFYGALLGWRFQSFGSDEQPYWVIETGEGSIGNAGARAGLGMVHQHLSLAESLTALENVALGGSLHQAGGIHALATEQVELLTCR